MRIEAIFKQSVIDDITKFWVATGRTFNADADGQAVFENVESYALENGAICIYTPDATYIYNTADFYRFKVTA